MLREIVHAGERLQEYITQIPERVIHFRRISDLTPGDIFNELYFNDGGELTLTFTFALDLPNIEAGTPEASAFANELEESYLQSIRATIKHIRHLVKDGSL